MSDFVFIWPLCTPSLNEWQRMHWRDRVNLGDRMKVVARFVAQKHGPHPAEPARVEITRHSVGVLDQDNLVGGCKPLVDALVSAGLIVDDSPQWLSASYMQAKAERGRGRTEVKVSYVSSEVVPTDRPSVDDDSGNLCPNCGSKLRPEDDGARTGRVPKATSKITERATKNGDSSEGLPATDRASKRKDSAERREDRTVARRIGQPRTTKRG